MSYGLHRRLQNVDRSMQLYIAAGVLLVTAPFYLPDFHLFMLSEVLVFGVLATAFNLLYGYTGLLSFGHAMFVAVAGYTVARFIINVTPIIGLGATANANGSLLGGLDPIVALVLAVALGVLATTVFAVPIGYLSVRLREIYFAMITLSFSMAIFVIANNNTGGLTNGDDGLVFILAPANVLGLRINFIDTGTFYLIVLAVSVPAMYALWRIVRSPFGMACMAIRENPERAESLGIDVTRHSWAMFVVSGAFSGLAGALLVPLRTNIHPSYAHWSFSAEPVIMSVIGGPYSFLGPLAGAFTVRYLRWIISQFPALEQYWQFFFGLIILVAVLYFTNGLMGGVGRLRRSLSRRRGGEVETDAERVD